MSSSTQTIMEKAPIRCLIIQLARTGDTIQSLMALRAAKQLYPQLEIHFLARERFAKAAKKVSWLTSVITLPTDSLLGPFLAGTKDETQTIAEIAQWIAPLIKSPWDMVVNWTFSEASSYLTSLLPAKVKLGYTRRNDSTFLGADGWSHYIQAIIQEGIGQNVHLTDILTTQLLTALQIHAGDPQSDAGAAVSSKGFFSLSMLPEEARLLLVDPSKKWIGFQLGTGNDPKSWPTKYWANLAQYIVNRHPEWGILLLGVQEDREKETAFMNALDSHTKGSSSIVSLVGHTSFDLWTAAISKCQWLFTADTAAVHLASVLGTRILNFSLGTPQYSERGPYGTGHYILAANSDQEPSSEITPEAAYVVWLYGSNEWATKGQISIETHALRLGWGDYLQKTKIFRSRIRDAADGGGVVYDRLVKTPIEINDWCSMVMGHVARAWYCGWVPPIGKELTRGDIGPLLVQKLRELQESAHVLFKICDRGYQAALSLNQKTSSMKSDKIMGVQDREELRELGKTLMDLENLLDRLVKTQVTLLPFSKMSKVLMHHLKGEHLSELGRETADGYKQLKEGVQIFLDWAKFTLELSKPVALKPKLVAPIERIGL
jgi:ADP-heptose:LPS heptosyltransferase